MNTPSASPSSLPAPTADTTTVAVATPIRQPLTKDQRDAIFAKAAVTMQPARAPAEIELIEWKPQIVEYYAKGFSAAQIRDILRTGGVTIGERIIQRFIARYARPRRRTAASPKRPPSDTSTATPATPSAVAEASPPRQSAVSPTSVARQASAKGSTEAVASKRT